MQRSPRRQGSCRVNGSSRRQRQGCTRLDRSRFCRPRGCVSVDGSRFCRRPGCFFVDRSTFRRPPGRPGLDRSTFSRTWRLLRGCDVRARGGRPVHGARSAAAPRRPGGDRPQEGLGERFGRGGLRVTEARSAPRTREHRRARSMIPSDYTGEVAGVSVAANSMKLPIELRRACRPRRWPARPARSGPSQWLEAQLVESAESPGGHATRFRRTACPQSMKASTSTPACALPGKMIGGVSGSAGTGRVLRSRSSGSGCFVTVASRIGSRTSMAVGRSID